MRCPNCGAAGETEVKVIDSRPLKGDTQRRRRYECGNCTHRFTTLEVYASFSRQGKKVIPALKLSTQQLVVLHNIRDEVTTLLQGANGEQ